MAGFTPHTETEIKEMLSAAGASSVEELFNDIPEDMRPKSFNIPAGESEFEVLKSLSNIADSNKIPKLSFLGGGYYNHYIPAAVDALSGRPEFFTAYTPYQPEASQGTLRAIFEYQTMIADLTGMDYANASLYDGGTALYEAVAMALRSREGNRIILDKGINPLHRKIVKTYVINLDVDIVEADLDDVYTRPENIKGLINDKTAAIAVANPNFFGYVSDYSGLFKYTAEKGIMNIVSFYPVSLGIFKTPGEMGADIAVAEGQSLGMPLSFGGPYLGIMAVNKKYVRKMPGRIAGETVDKEGKRAYVLTLQAREQHIRREKATSNICSNQALCSLRAVIFMSLYGKQGFRELAELNYERAECLKEEMSKINGVEVKAGLTFNEFTVKLPIKAEELLKRMIAKDIVPGIPASVFYGGMENELIMAATEKKTENEIHAFIEKLKESL